MQITILSGDDWTAVYKDGYKVEENHTVSLRRGLDVLGIDYEEREVEPEGVPADEHGPADPDFWTGNEFPDSL